MWGPSMTAPSAQTEQRSAPACLPDSERIQPGGYGTPAATRTQVLLPAWLSDTAGKYTSERAVGRRGHGAAAIEGTGGRRSRGDGAERYRRQARTALLP